MHASLLLFCRRNLVTSSCGIHALRMKALSVVVHGVYLLLECLWRPLMIVPATMMPPVQLKQRQSQPVPPCIQTGVAPQSLNLPVWPLPSA